MAVAHFSRFGQSPRGCEMRLYEDRYMDRGKANSDTTPQHYFESQRSPCMPDNYLAEYYRIAS